MVTREELIVATQEAAHEALLGLLSWDEAGVIARDVLDAIDALAPIDLEESQ